MQSINVTCAVILLDDLVFAAFRGGQHKTLPNHWEFPGGKVEAGESLTECIVREITEELSMNIRPLRILPSVFHDYGDFNIKLFPIICSVDKSEFELNEHASAGWFRREELQLLNWAPADISIVNQLLIGEI